MAQEKAKRQKKNCKSGQINNIGQKKIKRRLVRQGSIDQVEGFETARYDKIFLDVEIGKRQQNKITFGTNKQVFEIIRSQSSDSKGK